jgi:hypothetical protein
MTTRRLVVFSGFDTRFVAQAKISLKANQTDVVFTSATAGVERAYFVALLGQTLKTVNQLLSNNDARVVGMLASCIDEAGASQAEKEAFYPIFRRMVFPSSFRRDMHRVNEVVQKLVRSLSSEEFLDTHKYIKSPSAVLALPLLNADSRRLRRTINDLYEMKIFRPDGGIDKEVIRLRRGRGLRIKGIDFAACVNDSSHPVRRCTDSIVCDLAARLRLGFSVPARFEFDVSCEQGVSGKEFRLCDGSSQKIPGWADHLNMRINDDFQCGRRS